jgi:hypothetical protein
MGVGASSNGKRAYRLGGADVNLPDAVHLYERDDGA